MYEEVTPPAAPEGNKHAPEKRRGIFISKKVLLLAGGGFIALLVVVVLVAALTKKDTKTTGSTRVTGTQTQESDLGNANSTDPVEKGKALSDGACTGTGSKKLGSAPMRTTDISVIVPYGLLAGGHVTPVDHQYYWGKVQHGDPDMYDVLAPADGTIVGVQYRDRSQEGGAVKGDYRVVISYSCTFFSYFDLATSLSDDIESKLPSQWEKRANKSVHVKIAVKQGQVLGKVGGQSLDYAVWDTTKPLKNFLVPEAYNVAEPWKIVTAEPLNYYTDAVKKAVLPYYARTAEPRDGVIDQDVDGRMVGNWFLQNTYGYAGSAQFTGGDYYKGHLSLVRDLFDTGSFMYSTGDYQGQPQQFVIKSPGLAPDQVGTVNGLIKYQIAAYTYADKNGTAWAWQGPAEGIHVVPGNTQATVLLQLQESRLLKVEVFPGKTPDQVKGFTSAAKLYTRGEDAKNAPAIANPGAPTSTAT